MRTLVGKLDDLFGYGLTAFLRDPKTGTMTVSVTKVALTKARLSPEGWRYVLGEAYYVRTGVEDDWEQWLAESNKAVDR